MGLITFGTNVMVHELGFADCPKGYVFRGTKEYAAVKVQELLGILPAGRGGGAAYGQHPQQQAGMPGMGGARDPAIGRFLMPVADASFQFETVLDDLQRDAWPVPSDQRVARCTGVALQVCVPVASLADGRRTSRVCKCKCTCSAPIPFPFCFSPCWCSAPCKQVSCLVLSLFCFQSCTAVCAAPRRGWVRAVYPCVRFFRSFSCARWAWNQRPVFASPSATPARWSAVPCRPRAGLRVGPLRVIRDVRGRDWVASRGGGRASTTRITLLCLLSTRLKPPARKSHTPSLTLCPDLLCLLPEHGVTRSFLNTLDLLCFLPEHDVALSCPSRWLLDCWSRRVRGRGLGPCSSWAARRRWGRG